MVERDLRCVLPVVRRMRRSRSVRVRQLHKLPVIADLQAGGLHFVPGGDHVADKCGKAGDGGKIQHEFIRPQRLNTMLRVALTPLQYETVVAVYLHGHPQKEVAIDRGVSPASVCQLLQRAERRVGRYLGYL